jgi:hypothetical protein
MFPPRELPSIAVEPGAQVGRRAFRQKQFAFAQRTEGNRASGVGAFVQHELESSLLFCEVSARERCGYCTPKAEPLTGTLEVVNP